MKQLKRLTVLTHPGYSIDEATIDPQEEAMLRSIEAMVKGITKTKQEALLVLMHMYKDTIAERREDADDPRNIVFDMLERIQRKLRGACVRIDGTVILHISACVDYLEQTRAALLEQGLRLNSKTEIVGIGETPAACVPHVLQNFATLLDSAVPPKVLLDYTTAAQPENRTHWRRNGWKLQNAKRKWTGVRFVPLGTHKGVLETYEGA